MSISKSAYIFLTDGKALAMKYGVKYIETSPGINHNVDELLVGMLTQIKLREAKTDKREGNNKSGHKGLKVFDLFEKMWKMQDSKSKSCSNLHIL